MTELRFPELAVVQLVLAGSSGPEPLALAGVAFEVQLYAHHENDYHLAPFFSDLHGQVRISSDACRHFVEAHHDSGLMDYAGLRHCGAVVGIRHLSGEAVARAAEIRRTTWRELLAGERNLFRSIEELIALYEAAPNRELQAVDHPLRARWDGSTSTCLYEYEVVPKSAA